MKFNSTLPPPEAKSASPPCRKNPNPPPCRPIFDPPPAAHHRAQVWRHWQYRCKLLDGDKVGLVWEKRLVERKKVSFLAFHLGENIPGDIGCCKILVAPLRCDNPGKGTLVHHAGAHCFVSLDFLLLLFLHRRHRASKERG